VKATFDISMETNRPEISEEQEQPYKVDVFRDDPANSSIQSNCDFALAKQKVDVLLHATAYAPREEPVTELMTGFIVGSLKKTLIVYGNRYYDRFLGVLYKTPPNKFKHMPITYERAFGGWERKSKEEFPRCEYRNLAGTGFFKKRSSAIDQNLPNVEYADFPTKRNSKKNKIAGYGPIAPNWAPRMDYAGSSSVAGDREISMIRPKDFNPMYYQAAPEDQQLDVVNGGEPVILYRLHPKYSEIHTRLPALEIGFETLIENEIVKRQGKLQSIIFTPDQLKLQMVWQANFKNGRDFSAIKSTQITHTFFQL
ncbi:MAG: DUF2169 domain-containing protein, partial [Proteobacteria bacterium]|nr:DUF2169 domain-containing protein [Pseudomonadota bacterium]